MIPDAPQDRLPVLVDEPWKTRYEEMRSQVMTELGSIDHAYGYVLLVRRGLAAGMKAWPQPASQASCDRRSGQPLDAVTIPSHLLQSATSLLVNIILIFGTQTEVPMNSDPAKVSPNHLDRDACLYVRQFNDRLLLGLKGTISEAELHVLRARRRSGRNVIAESYRAIWLFALAE